MKKKRVRVTATPGPARPSVNQLKMRHAIRELEAAVNSLRIAADEVGGVLASTPCFDKISAAKLGTEIALTVARDMLRRVP